MIKILILLIVICSFSLSAFAQGDYAKELIKKAEELEKSGNTQEAILSYQEAIGYEPSHYSLYREVGKLYEDLSREHRYDYKKISDRFDPMDPYLEKAIEYHLKGLDLLPEDKKIEVFSFSGYANIALLYRITGSFSEELAFYKKYYQDDPTIKAHVEKKVGKIAKGPDDKFPYIYLGELYCQLGRYEDAILTWQKGLQERKISEATLFHENYNGDFISYICENFLKEHPDDPAATYVLASVYRVLGKEEDAAKLLVQPTGPKDGFTYKETAKSILGKDYLDNVMWMHIRTVSPIKRSSENAEQVIFNCNKAIEAGVNDEEVYWMLGEGYFLQKDYAQAIAAGLRSLQVKSGFYPALHLLIRSYSCNGEYEKALDICLQATEVSSEGVSIPHLSYFYSLCRMLMATNKYETALFYYEKLSELSSRVKIDRKYINDPNHFDLQQEISHVWYYINSPIKNYPPKLDFRRSTPEERQDFRVSLADIKVSESSENITVYAVSAEEIDPRVNGEGRPWISWWGAVGGTSGRTFLVRFGFEYKGSLRSAMMTKGVGMDEFRINYIPDKFRFEVLVTRDKAMMKYLRETKDYFQISEDIIAHLSFDEPNNLYTYSSGSQYKGVPLKEDTDFYSNRSFTVRLFDEDVFGRENRFEIHNSMYPLPAEEIPANPLISEEKAKKIAVDALRQEYERYAGSAVEQGTPPKLEELVSSLASISKKDTAIGKIELCVQPQVISFKGVSYLDLSSDLFDPCYDFAEYRLVWLAMDEGMRYLVKIDAITGEVLSKQYIGPRE